MILSAQSIRRRKGMITPFFEKTRIHGLSFGLGHAGYDIRIGKIEGDVESLLVNPGDFVLLSAMEHMAIPDDLMPMVKDKSTIARLGLAVQNTVIEPGWRGYLTLELSNHSRHAHIIQVGQPIAQIVFFTLDEPTDTPYSGKYQDQEDRPVPAILDA